MVKSIGYDPFITGAEVTGYTGSFVFAAALLLSVELSAPHGQRLTRRLPEGQAHQNTVRSKRLSELNAESIRITLRREQMQKPKCARRDM